MNTFKKMIALSLIMMGVLTIVGSGGGGGDDDSGSEPVIEQVAAPQITPASGKFISEQAIRITCATEEVTIRYTIDNTNPSETAGTLIPQGTTFTLSRSATVKAIAYKSGMTASAITSVSYTFQQWTWVSGDSTTDEAGVYGTSSDKPGARDSGVSWTDPDGNFWLFGGFGYDTDGISGNLNDLWKFDGAEWEMVSGDTAYGKPGEYETEPYQPGARQLSASWTDLEGNLWLFGGFGLDTNGVEGDLNDLWKFDRTSEEWEWVSGYDTYGQQGESDLPGARDSSVTWTDLDGNLWLFGGYGLDMYGGEGNLNDLWKFDTATEEWTLVSGSDAIDEEGNYVTGETNFPGARYGSISWTDPEGNLWLFGGAFYDVVGDYSYNFNDLWKFDTAAEEWTWVSGSDSPDESGVYGTIGTAGESYMPGARSYSLSWIDSSGYLWLFGGLGYDSSGSYGDMNDLWQFNPSTGLWTWVSGSASAGQSGIYGSKGTPSVSNTPGARTSAVSWIDSDDHLWLFGGYYYDSDDEYEHDMNDLWRFEP